MYLYTCQCTYVCRHLYIIDPTDKQDRRRIDKCFTFTNSDMDTVVVQKMFRSGSARSEDRGL